MVNNIVIEPSEPHDLKAKAAKMLKILLNGEVVSRRNCHIHGIADFNDSIHSIGSHIRNKLYIPLISSRQPPDKRVVSYLMSRDEINRYNDPSKREIQKQEMIQEVGVKRKSRLLKICRALIDGELQKPEKHQDQFFLENFNLNSSLFK